MAKKLVDTLRQLLNDSGKKEFTLAEVLLLIKKAEFLGMFKLIKGDKDDS